MDFSKVQSEIFDLTEKLKLINSVYKLDQNALEFIISEQGSMLKLNQQIKVYLNILKKSKKNSAQIGQSLPMKSKKLAEKELVCKQIDEQKTLAKKITKNKLLRALINDATNKSKPHRKTIRDNHLKTISKKCYICKNRFNTEHHFYDQMCIGCGDFNFSKRLQTCDLNGKIAVVTGCRIKIGYEICLYLLRNNCSQLIGTTRFPKDAFLRFSQEPDFDSFKSRLYIYPLDLRDLNSIAKFVTYLNNSLPKLDILINNAAQTIRRSTKFYEHLLEIEARSEDKFDQSIQNILISDKSTLEKKYLEYDLDGSDITLEPCKLALSVMQSQLKLTKDDIEPMAANFPKDVYDKDGQQVDLSSKCSWNKTIEEIDIFEFAETQVINSWAPFMLCSRLKNLMSRKLEEPKFVVNVSSMEGKFTRYKNITHPHTNMSKASLNMLTRTCGPDFALNNIFITSVDTGWVTEMNPNCLYSYKKTVPLDEIDGAIRVLDPIIQGYNNNVFLHSVFLKDFKKTEW